MDQQAQDLPGDTPEVAEVRIISARLEARPVRRDIATRCKLDRFELILTCEEAARG